MSFLNCSLNCLTLKNLLKRSYRSVIEKKTFLLVRTHDMHETALSCQTFFNICSGEFSNKYETSLNFTSLHENKKHSYSEGKTFKKVFSSSSTVFEDLSKNIDINI